MRSRTRRASNSFRSRVWSNSTSYKGWPKPGALAVPTLPLAFAASTGPSRRKPPREQSKEGRAMTKPKIENRLWIRVPIEFVPILDRLAREQWTSKEQVARAFIVEGVRRQLEAQGLDGASP